MNKNKKQNKKKPGAVDNGADQEHETCEKSETLIYSHPDLLPLDYITRTALQEVTGASDFLFQLP